MIRNQLRWLILVPALCLMAGCGYRAGFLIPADIRTVNVNVVANETFWREVTKTDNRGLTAAVAVPRAAYPMSVDLTEQITNEIVRRTPLKFASEADADSVLETRITGVRLAGASRDGADNVIGATVEITVAFAWRDRRNGRVMASQSGISRSTSYHINQQENFTTASRRSFEHIAERIVEGMQERF